MSNAEFQAVTNNPLEHVVACTAVILVRLDVHEVVCSAVRKLKSRNTIDPGCQMLDNCTFASQVNLPLSFISNTHINWTNQHDRPFIPRSKVTNDHLKPRRRLIKAKSFDLTLFKTLPNETRT